MKTSVTSYSFGKYAAKENLGYEGIIKSAAELGFDGIEFTENYWCTEEGAPEKIKECCEKYGIEPVLFAVGADFINGSGGDCKAEIKRVCGLVDMAQKMGVAKLRHDITRGFINGQKFSIGYDDALKTAVYCCREITEYAEQKGIMTCTENHGFFSQDAQRVEKLINSVAHKNFGALVDIGNFMCADEDPTVSVGIMAPYAIHVHAKDFHFKSGMDVDPGKGWFRTRAGNYLRGSVIGHGNAKVYQSLQTLKRAGYDGYITVEFEGMEDNLKGIALGLENLKRFW